MITGKTKLLGVIGHPVSHSLSPVMHNAALASLGLDYVYLPLPVKPEDLPAAIQGFAAIGLIGFNITIPHKTAILPFLSTVSTDAEAVGAVNTVWRTDAGWAGTNTDVKGFLAPLLGMGRNERQDWNEKVAVILGNGGASRAVVAGCTQLGCNKIYVVGRNYEQLEKFRNSWNNSPLADKLADKLHVCTWDKLPSLVAFSDLLVNTTPVGMYPHVEQSPLSSDEISLLPKGAIAYDLIYTPRPTQFLQHAKAHGALTIDGLPMLVQQGAAALEIWLQQPAPVDIMHQALEQWLESRG